jgi:P27 family predicted phage terminase small subunit
MTRLDPPDHYDAERKAIWSETVSRLTAAGRVFRADIEVLNTYVEAVRSHRQASRMLADTNVLVVRNGQARENPALAVQRKTAEAMARASKALGLDRTPGPIAEEPPSSPIAPRWCEEHKRKECRHNRQDGGPCHQYRLVAGLDVCRKHGGKSLEALREDGRQRALEAQAQKLLYQRDAPPVTDPLSALQRLAGRAAAWEDIIGEKVNDLHSLRYSTEGGEQLRSEIVVMERAMDRLGSLLVNIAKLNIESRLATVREATAQMLEQALNAALTSSGCDLDGQQRAREAFRRNLKVVA